ncbi:MAG TPA: hypothetical protein VJH37_05210 [Candidatus Nanoarchaeia archaeon]|nr:hypothetical protein [Candidatus Nanoarchaeia archaeon]
MDYRDYTLLLLALVFGLIVAAVMKLNLKPIIHYPLLGLAVLLLAGLFVVFLNRLNEPAT